MPTLLLDADAIPETSHHQIFLASRVEVSLSQPPKSFFRHGWQSSALAAWLDPTTPPVPIRAKEPRIKGEDIVYETHKNHVSAWVSAVELGEDDILLLGALCLSGRIELDVQKLTGFYESECEDGWLVARGTEEEVFRKYTNLLETRLGKSRFEKPPRVWCSWYSLYKWINETNLSKALHGLGDLPFDVFQVDDGWQDHSGNWEAGKNFPSGMATFAEKIKATGRTAGIWLSPFIVMPEDELFHEHPEWLLRDDYGNLIPANLNWKGTSYALDITHPEVLEWLDQLIRRVVGWGYGYLKLDFLYAGAMAGKRFRDTPRELAYRNAMQVIREAAGDAYILACGAPIIPSLGLCDGLRVGPDVSPYWLNKAASVWLNNPNDTSTQNAIRTTLHRIWLKPLVHIDPDVLYFRSKYNSLTPQEAQLLQDLGMITGFKATSDLPCWLKPSEKEKVQELLATSPTVKKMKRYEYQIDGRVVDFNQVIPIPISRMDIPIQLAKSISFFKVMWHQALPAMFESRM